MGVGADTKPRLRRLPGRAAAPETKLQRLPRRDPSPRPSYRPLLGLKPEPLLVPRDPMPDEPLMPELDELLLTFLDDGKISEPNADTRGPDVDDEEEDTSEDSRPAFLPSLAPPDKPGSDSAKTVVARPVKRRNTPRVESGQRETQLAHPQVGRVVKGESLLETPPPEQPIDAPQSTTENELLYEPAAFNLDNSAAILLPSSEFGRPPFELLDLDERCGTVASRWLWPLLIALMVLVGSVGAYLLRTTGG
jgi:hypothetical protein